jgi:NAD(P)-dependent dehydrogenase (short-subunit alcohol dehydrogenase family)
VERILAVGRVDALANAAGTDDDFSAHHEVSEAMWARVFAVDVEALMRLGRAVLPAVGTTRRTASVYAEEGLRVNAAVLPSDGGWSAVWSTPLGPLGAVRGEPGASPRRRRRRGSFSSARAGRAGAP